MKIEKKIFNVFLILINICLFIINFSYAQEASTDFNQGVGTAPVEPQVLPSPEIIASPLPVATIFPVSSPGPIASILPLATLAPASTPGPVVSASPVATILPISSPEPVASISPLATLAPASTPEPLVSASPVATILPVSSPEPVASVLPVESALSVSSIATTPGVGEPVEDKKAKKRAKKEVGEKSVASKKNPKKNKSMADLPDQEVLELGESDADIEKIIADEEKGVYLGQYLEPWKGLDPNEVIEMNFDNDEISELISFLEDNLNITFILDDYIEPKRADGLKPIAGTKITFKSHRPLTLKEVWQIGLTFLEMAGFSAIPTTLERTYHITTSAAPDAPSANKAPLPTFIGSDLSLLPDSDIKIRYVYFIENADIETISKVVDTMRSASSAPIIKFPELKAIIMTDKSANIKSLLKILEEIDKVSMPETLSIIRLKHADATKIRELYTELIGKDQKAAFAFRPKKTSSTQYFTEATRVFDDPRTNSLIVLGTKENIRKFEEFVFKYVDKKSDLPYSPLHIQRLRYIDAESIAQILNETISKFNADPSRAAAAPFGGVRDGNKFFKSGVKITAEPSGNRLIINADYDDYLKIREIIEKLDVEQPQVAIKVLILNVDLSNTNQLGVQLRNTVNCCDGSGNVDTLLGRNVNFQTSGIAGSGPIITDNSGNGAVRLLGNLIQLANTTATSPGLFQAGSTLVTLGQDIFGFWGLLNALESYTRVSVVANPFLVTNNKYKAEISTGETRRVNSAIIYGQQTAQGIQDLSANLDLIITPQISYDDMIKLNVYVQIAQFDDAANTAFGPSRIVKQISTEALLANKEVIALGGLIRDTTTEVETKVPILGDIPLVGWLFKNKSKVLAKSSLLILISPEIIKIHEPEVAQKFTYQQLQEVKETYYSMKHSNERRDPIHRWFFNDHKEKEITTIDKFASIQKKYVQAGKQKGPSTILAYDDDKSKLKNKSLLDLVDPKNKISSGVIS